jgi:hypothetical protein
VDAGFDTGELITMSSRIAMPPHVSVVDMHKISSPLIAKFAVPELARIAEEFVGVKAAVVDAC